MNIIWSNQIDKILSSGISLSSIGIKNWALTRVDAINAIDKLKKLDVAILGGDVYILVNNIPSQAYDNWHCDQMTGESNHDFIKRSANEAIKYIANYPPKDVFFAIVPNA